MKIKTASISDITIPVGRRGAALTPVRAAIIEAFRGLEPGRALCIPKDAITDKGDAVQTRNSVNSIREALVRHVAPRAETAIRLDADSNFWILRLPAINGKRGKT